MGKQGKWKIWTGLFILFVSGILVGSVGSRLYMQRQISHALSGERPVFRNLYTKRLTHKLNLSSDQQEELEKIAEQTAKSFHSIRQKHRKEIDALFDQHIAEMKKHLSQKQALELDAVHEKMKKRHRRFRGPRHPGRPPHGPMGDMHPPPFCPRGLPPIPPDEEIANIE